MAEAPSDPANAEEQETAVDDAKAERKRARAGRSKAERRQARVGRPSKAERRQAKAGAERTSDAVDASDIEDRLARIEEVLTEQTARNEELLQKVDALLSAGAAEPQRTE